MGIYEDVCEPCECAGRWALARVRGPQSRYIEIGELSTNSLAACNLRLEVVLSRRVAVMLYSVVIAGLSFTPGAPLDTSGSSRRAVLGKVFGGAALVAGPQLAGAVKAMTGLSSQFTGGARTQRARPRSVHVRVPAHAMRARTHDTRLQDRGHRTTF